MPCLKHIEQRSVVITIGLIQAQTEFSVYFTYFKSIHIFQCKEGVQARGYSAATVENVTEEAIKKYIREQSGDNVCNPAF